jgi:hypothetical protein
MRLNLAQTWGENRSRFATFAGCACAVAVMLGVGGCRHRNSDDLTDAGIVIDDSAGGGGTSVAGSNAAGSGTEKGGSAAPAQCKRADGLDGPGAPRDSCTSKRAYLKCDLPGGVTELCLSDDPTRCPDEGVSGGAAAMSCSDQCAADEYAVACGRIGPNVGSAAPPDGCRSLLAGPGGGISYCCPCL